MGVHVYCVVHAGDSPAEGTLGLQDAPVRAVTAGDLALWVSTHDQAVRASISAAREHNRVVQAAMTTESTPVPIRFGQWFESDRDAVDRTAADADRWQALLDRFAGKAEYGIRLLEDEGAAREMHTSPQESGTAYMADLARRSALAGHFMREAERLAELIGERAGTMLGGTRVSAVSGGGASIAHLLAWDDIDVYHSILRSVCEAEPSLRLVFTGPWPPYSFVE